MNAIVIMAREPVPGKVKTRLIPELGEEKTAPAGNRFYSPVVLSIARTEGISSQELEQIPGTGINGRVSKKDVLTYLENRKTGQTTTPAHAPTVPSVQFAPGENTLFSSG